MMPMPSGPASPQGGTSSPSPSPQGGAPQGLVGPSQGQDPSQLSPTPEQMNEAFMAETQDLTMRITSLARQYPAAAENYEVAIQSLIEGMTKAIIASTNTEPGMTPSLVG